MARYNVSVKKNGKIEKIKMAGTYRLTEPQVKWLERQWAKEKRARKRGKKGKRGWTEFRKKQLPRKLTLGEKAWAAARQDVGVVEQGGNNRGPRVDAIIKSNGGVPGEAWCGDAVANWYRTAGSKSVQRAWAAVRFLGHLTGQRILNQRSMRKGDIVVFDFDHTGLFGWYADARGNRVSSALADYIVTIEGNTGDSGEVSDSPSGDGVKQKLRPIYLVKHGVRVLR